MTDLGSKKTTAGQTTATMGRRTLLQLAGGAAGLAAVGAPIREAFGQSASVLVVAETFNIKTLDPSRSIEGTQMMVNRVLYDTLVTFDGEDIKTPKPSLATEWKVSSDGKVYTFTLRPGVKFTSGNPLTAEDVKWTIERMMHLKATTAFFVEGIEKVEAPNTNTIVVHLKQPQSSLLAILTTPSLGILDSKTVIANGGDASPDAKTKDKAEQYLNAKSAGSGSYVLQAYTPEQEFVLVKNPNYWRGAAKIDRIVIRNIAEAASQELLMKKGDVDIALNIGHDQIASLQRAGVTVRSSAVSVIFYLQMNEDPAISGSFANPAVRQAARYAIDYEGLLTIAGPGSAPLAGLLPTIFPGAPDPKEAVKQDRARAVAILKKANLTDVSGKLTFYQDATVNGVSMNLLAQKLQSDMAAVGIKLELGGMPLALAVAQWRAAKTGVGLFRWVADFADPSNYLSFLPDGAVGKRSNWTAQGNPTGAELVKLGQEARTEMDGAKRASLFQNLQRKLVEAGPYIPLFQPAAPYAHTPKISNATYHSVWRIDFYTVAKSA
jgi:peptide/nickel transport system substrate-binding protein